jgi:integrase
MRIAKPWFRQQDGWWYVWFEGKQVKLAKDEGKAKAKYRAMLDRGTPLSDQTVREVLAAYWTWARRNLAPATTDRRKPILDSFSDSIRPSLKADDLRPYHVQKWIEANDKCKVRKGKVSEGEAVRVEATDREISSTTEATRIGLIKGVMSWARSMGYVERNPIADMPKPRAKVRQEFIPGNLWPRVLELATDDCWREYLTVMLSSGARPQEMRKVTAKEFDEANKRFVFEIDDSKGKRISRVVYLPEDALAIVKRLVGEYAEGPLFRNRKGRPWTNNAIRCRFRFLKKELKMPNLTATTLRHSFAHHRLTSGQDALTVSKLMGHVNVTMLAMRYGHLDANVGYMQSAANAVPMPIPVADNNSVAGG